ncbi:MAG: hypothetical protein WD491_10610 [Balneolales bacterium]
MKKYHRLISIETQNEWESCLEGIPHTFGHTWEHCYAMYLNSGLPTFLYCFEKDDIRVVCPIVERNFGGYKDITKPFGFSGFVANKDCPDFSVYWQDFVRSRGYVCGYLGLNPIFDYGSLFESSEIHAYNNAYVLDLKLSVNELLAGMATKRRQQFNNWDETVSNFILDKSELINFFHEQYDAFLLRKNASAFYYFAPKTLTYLSGLNNVILVGVKLSGKIVAATLFAYTKHMGDALYHASLPGCQKHSAPLLWYGALQLKSLKVPALNLGGGSGGIADFKRRFGAQKRPLRCLKQVYREDINEKLCEGVNVDPTDISGFFPAYRHLVA